MGLARRRPFGSGTSDEGAQRAGLVFDLVEPVLDQIADADDAAKPPVLHDGEVTNAPACHLRHQFADALGRIASDDRPGHDLRHTQGQQAGTVTGKGMDDIAFRDNPLYLLAVLAGNEGADISVDQHVDGGADGFAGPDRFYCPSLGAQDGFDVHGKASLSRGAPRADANVTERPLCSTLYRTICRTNDETFPPLTRSPHRIVAIAAPRSAGLKRSCQRR